MSAAFVLFCVLTKKTLLALRRGEFFLGREFPYVIFWNLSSPNERWTRPNAYVAVSRGKQRVWIAGRPEDFFGVCAQVDIKRRTIFRLLLSEAGLDNTEPVPYEPSPILPLSSLKVMNKNMPCVWTLAACSKLLAEAKE